MMDELMRCKELGLHFCRRARRSEKTGGGRGVWPNMVEFTWVAKDACQYIMINKKKEVMVSWWVGEITSAVDFCWFTRARCEGQTGRGDPGAAAA